MLFSGDIYQPQGQIQTQSEREENDANGIQRKVGGAILISDKIDFKIEKITRNRDGYFIMIKRKLYKDTITFLSTYAPKLTELKRETDKNTIMAGDVNTSLTAMYRPSKQKNQQRNIGLR